MGFPRLLPERFHVPLRVKFAIKCYATEKALLKLLSAYKRVEMSFGVLRKGLVNSPGIVMWEQWWWEENEHRDAKLTSE